MSACHFFKRPAGKAEQTRENPHHPSTQQRKQPKRSGGSSSHHTRAAHTPPHPRRSSLSRQLRSCRIIAATLRHPRRLTRLHRRLTRNRAAGTPGTPPRTPAQPVIIYRISIHN